MTKSWNEIKDTAKIHLDDDMQIAYEKGYSDASNEILTERSEEHTSELQSH